MTSSSDWDSQGDSFIFTEPKTFAKNSKIKVSLNTHSSGPVLLDGVLGLNVTQATNIRVFYEIVRDDTVSLTNGPRLLFELYDPNPTKTSFRVKSIPFQLVDQKTCPGSKHEYTLILSNQSTVLQNLFTFVDIGLSFLTYQLIAPVSCLATRQSSVAFGNCPQVNLVGNILNIPGAQQKSFSQVLITGRGSVHLYVNLTIGNYSLQSVQPILQFNILRDTQSLTNGFQYLVAVPSLLTSTTGFNEFNASFSILDNKVAAGRHQYTLVLQNASQDAKGNPQTLQISNLDFQTIFNVPPVSPVTFNQLLDIQSFGHSESDPGAIVIGPEKTGQLELSVPFMGQTKPKQVFLKALLNFSLYQISWAVQVDLLRNGTLLQTRRFQVPYAAQKHFMHTVVPFFYIDQFAKVPWPPELDHVTYTLEIHNHSDPPMSISLNTYSWVGFTNF